ncbi:MAG: hypothetical protein JOZ72_09530 [Alphaproteobacteria bacterium]|nr:hypothetical protein [Alphaproteobacteria bacterium]
MQNRDINSKTQNDTIDNGIRTGIQSGIQGGIDSGIGKGVDIGIDRIPGSIRSGIGRIGILSSIVAISLIVIGGIAISIIDIS